MAGDRWEEGEQEKNSRVMIYSSSDLCGKIKDTFHLSTAEFLYQDELWL